MFQSRLLLATVCFVLSVSMSCRGEDRYKRSDCISVVQLTWPKSASYDSKVAVMNQISLKKAGVRQLAGLTMPPKTDRIYLQYKTDCGDKTRLSTTVMESLRASIEGFPFYKVSELPIYPSPKTIDLKGPEWTDTAKH